MDPIKKLFEPGFAFAVVDLSGGVRINIHLVVDRYAPAAHHRFGLNRPVDEHDDPDHQRDGSQKPKKDLKKEIHKTV